MKWVLIIVGIIGIYVVYLVLRFTIDSVKQSRRMKTQGGVREKYSVLINYFLKSDPRTKVFQETNTFISIGISGIAGSQVYYIQQTFSTVTVQMRMNNNPLFGNLKMEWNFPEDMDQNLMFTKINNDIEAKLNTLLESNP